MGTVLATYFSIVFLSMPLQADEFIYDGWFDGPGIVRNGGETVSKRLHSATLEEWAKTKECDSAILIACKDYQKAWIGVYLTIEGNIILASESRDGYKLPAWKVEGKDGVNAKESTGPLFAVYTRFVVTDREKDDESRILRMDGDLWRIRGSLEDPIHVIIGDPTKDGYDIKIDRQAVIREATKWKKPPHPFIGEKAMKTLKSDPQADQAGSPPAKGQATTPTSKVVSP